MYYEEVVKIEQKQAILLLYFIAFLLVIVAGVMIMLVYKFFVLIETDYIGQDVDVSDWKIVAGRYAEKHEGDYIFCNGTNRDMCFNCANFSVGLYKIARELGFEVELVTGCKKDNGSDCHMWVRPSFDVDSQLGDFVDFDKTYTNQSVVEWGI